MTLKGRAFSGPPPARLDLEPAKRGESIKPRVERSGTLGICNEIICKPAKRAAADG